MLLADSHNTMVIGVDVHVTTAPPFNPIHPYVGMVIDPADYIPFLGTNVSVNGLKRGVSDTGGMIIPLMHIPLAGPFAMASMIGNESMNFFASQNTFCDGSRMSPKGYMVMTCNDVGIPLSAAIGKNKAGKTSLIPSLFAPTSFSLPVPTGKPVMVGGPYVPDWGGMLAGLAASIGFSSLIKLGSKGVKKLSSTYTKKARNLMNGIADNTSLSSGKKKIGKTKSEVPKDKKIKPKPPFKKNPKHSSTEFNKQLKDQQDAINKMQTKEWLKNRENFKNRDKADYNKRAKQARDEYREKIRNNKYDEYLENPKNNYTPEQASAKADEFMKGKAALHNPDGVAGGKVDQITGMGDSRVNSSIGSQWANGRAASIENQIKQSYGIPPNSIEDIPDDAMMNVDLF